MESNDKKTIEWGKLKTTVRNIVILLIAAAAVEILFFNFRTFQSLFYREFSYKEFDYSVSGATAYENDIYSFTSDEEHVLHITNINQNVKNIRMDIEVLNDIRLNYLEDDVCKVGLDVSDEGNAIPYRITNRSILHSNAASQYAWVQLYGNMIDLDITMAVESGYLIQIHDITFNARRPLLFSFTRFLILFTAMIIVYSFRTGSVLWKADCVDMKRWQWGVSAVIGAGIIMLFWFMISNNEIITYSGYYAHYQELARALDAGQVSILELPPEELNAMENPYDSELRSELVGDGHWDYAYYNGKYYVYFGILPCLIFYWPFYHMTGLNLPNVMPIMIGVILFGTGIFMLFKEIITRFFKNVPFAVLLLLTAACIFGCQIPEFINNPSVYDVPIAMAMALTVWGLYLWIASARDEESLHTVKLLAGSVFMALVAACRPNMVIYSFLALPIFAGYIKKKHAVRNIVILLIPYVLTAAGVMYYNAIRFDSVFDFGNTYNLTSNDLTHSAFSLDKVALAVNCFLLKLPRFNWRFPYILYTGLEGNPFGHTYVYVEQIYAGLLVANPILWSIFTLYSKKNKTEEKRLRLFCTTALVCAVIVMLFTAEAGGISYRYIADFSPVCFVVALIAVCTMIEKNIHTDRMPAVGRMIAAACIISIVFHMNLLFIPCEKFPLNDGNTELFYRLFYGFNFW